MKVGMDIDGTLAEPMELLCKDYNIEVPSTWNYFKTIGMSEQFIKDFTQIWNKRWKEVPLIEQGAPYIMEKLVKKGVIFDIITACQGVPKKKWIEYNNIPHDKFITVEHGRDKAVYDYDLFVDDSPPNYKAFIKAGKKCALYDRSWNRDVDAEIRIQSIAEIENYL